MKFILKLIPTIFFITLILSACDDGTTYAEQLKAEKSLIASYIKRNKINVLTKLPAANAWNSNDYYLSPTSGLYFHLAYPGDTISKTDTLKSYDKVVVRYIQYTLTENPDTIFSWTTIDSPYPVTFNYQNTNQACEGWHEAVKYMDRNEAIAKIIVPSKIGFETNMVSVTPLCYDMKIQIQKY